MGSMGMGWEEDSAISKASGARLGARSYLPPLGLVCQPISLSLPQRRGCSEGDTGRAGDWHLRPLPQRWNRDGSSHKEELFPF